MYTCTTSNSRMFTFQPIQRCILSSINLFKLNSLIFFICSIWIAFSFFNVRLIYANGSALKVFIVLKKNHLHKRKWNPFWLKCMENKIFFGWKICEKHLDVGEKIFSISFLAFKIISWNSKLSLDPPTQLPTIFRSRIFKTCGVK